MVNLPRKLNQEGSEGSSNYQAGNDLTVINHGISVADARAIAEDVVRINLIEFRDQAVEIALRRMTEFFDRWAARMQGASPAALEGVKEPDVQVAIAAAGAGYVRTGDDDLGEILVDLLADRCSVETRSLEATVLNEAISVASRLTDGQIAALAVAWTIRATVNPNYRTKLDVLGFVAQIASQFASRLPRGAGSYHYLASTGTCDLVDWPMPLALELSRTYPGAFTSGFTDEQILPVVLPLRESHPQLFRPCANGSNMLQLDAITLSELKRKTRDLDEATRSALEGLLQNHPPEDYTALKEEISNYSADIADLQNLWIQTPLGSVKVTTTGTTIGHAEYRRIMGGAPPLRVWVSDDAPGDE